LMSTAPPAKKAGSASARMAKTAMRLGRRHDGPTGSFFRDGLPLPW
jgi:hypothetical protein